MNNTNIGLKNQAGFGLIGTLIAMGLASVILLGIMDMLAYSASAQRGIQIKANETAFKGNLTNILLQDPTCTNSLRGNHVSEPLKMYDPANPSVSLASAGMNFREWDVSSLQLTNQQLVDSAMNLYSADVSITLSHSFKVVGLLPSTTSHVATVYYTASNGVISRCFGGTNVALAAKNYCATMGGSWSDSTIACTLPSVASAAAPAPTQNTTVLSATEMSTPPSDIVSTTASSAITPSTAPATVAVTAGNTPSASDDNHSGYTVLQVVAAATGTINMAVANTPAALVITGVDHSVGGGKNK